ncbi:hypothetical protein NDU88_003631 [Pleurodeles waltl]|uniref:Uncharacterized protein n=1 Tax=Pleurodeles waltl TaxID=8319 RepID=A0AAV7VGJ1_PLEWA|nr:hypothetical protein NDU88_003631 [Pleurodeles waltl]
MDCGRPGCNPEDADWCKFIKKHQIYKFQEPWALTRKDRVFVAALEEALSPWKFDWLKLFAGDLNTCYELSEDYSKVTEDEDKAQGIASLK